MAFLSLSLFFTALRTCIKRSAFCLPAYSQGKMGLFVCKIGQIDLVLYGFETRISGCGAEQKYIFDFVNSVVLKNLFTFFYLLDRKSYSTEIFRLFVNDL